jgi:hypothetical protein
VAFKIADGYVEVHGRLDEPSFRRAAERAGGRAGDRFATVFGLSSSRRFRRMTRLFMEPINAIQSALSALRGPSLRAGILSTILALIPSAGKAAAALGASLIPALISLGSVVGVVRLMLGKLQSDIKGQTLKALNDLAGGIRNLAREAAKPGLNKLMEGVVKNGPMFERYIQSIARSVGDALGEVGDLLGDQGFVDKLNSLLEQTAESTSIWTRSLDDVVEMIVTLGDAASPIFRDMAERVNILTDRWRDWLNLKHETGELQQFLQDAAEELNRWGRIFNNIIIGLYNIFAAGVGPSSQFAENLERITASFRDWTEQSENVEKVRKVFQWMVDHVDDFFRVAAAATAIAGALKGIGLAVSTINFVQLAASLGPVGIALGLIALAIAGVAAAFMVAYNSSESFRAKVSELWSMIQERLFPILQEWWTWIQEELAPVLERFANETLQTVIDGLDTLIDKYEENKEGIKELRNFFLELIPVFGLVAKVAIAALVGLGTQILTVAGWAGRLVGVIKRVPIKWVTKYLFQPGAAISAILRVTGLTKRIPKAWKTVYNFLRGSATRLISNLTSLIRRIPRLARTLYRFLGFSAAVSAIRRIKGWLASIPRAITTRITTFRDTIFRKIFGGAHGGIIGARGMASGGLSGAGSTILVGEQGPELVNLPFGSRVTPAGQSQAQMAKAGKGGEFTLRIESGGSRMDDLLVEIIRKAVSSRGGNVQVALGR